MVFMVIMTAQLVLIVCLDKSMVCKMFDDLYHSQ